MNYIKLLFLIALTFCTVYAGIADTLFELDGNPNSVVGEDWDTLYKGLGTEQSFSNINYDPSPQTIFTGGGSKDVREIREVYNELGARPVSPVTLKNRINHRRQPAPLNRFQMHRAESFGRIVRRGSIPADFDSCEAASRGRAYRHKRNRWK